ncbi:biotin-dependent carboxyltransferase family protein [Psychrobacillus soli]|uniref:Biotin-dependent carboxyltransferase n=1 Tax=Psychrobacillus soli TaxID=1543965 RepID=A0A544T8F1_9BACI|nr:biotin-dependent carboxyltransferase family protein [Psychrobacillus soli]TQR13741.1 biotin-dependent carboxyltransferase [Psychrobacillus soli]
MEYVSVLKPGLLTTIQDLGRPMYRTLGVSASGAMDPLSFRLANILVGNEEGEAALEVTLIGPYLQFHNDGVIAITGGNLSPKLNGQAVTMWKALRVKQGDELRFGNCVDGCRAYIAFAGGIDTPEIMGSQSTFIRGNYGGKDGRALKAGDRLPLGISFYGVDDLTGRRIRPADVPDFTTDRPVQFIVGPHEQEFTDESFASFLNKPYTVSNESDRMGYRLQGPILEHVNSPDIISDFITVGTIQVPGSGQPIIHMADCGTSGGYTKIGVITTIDLPYVAQRKPGDNLTFQPVAMKVAQLQLRKQERFIAELRLVNKSMTKLRVI